MAANGESKLNVNSYISIGLVVIVIGMALAVIKTKDDAIKELRQERDVIIARLERERIKDITSAIEPVRAEVIKNTQNRETTIVKLTEISVTLAVMQKDIESLRNSAMEMLRSLKSSPSGR